MLFVLLSAVRFLHSYCFVSSHIYVSLQIVVDDSLFVLTRTKDRPLTPGDSDCVYGLLCVNASGEIVQGATAFCLTDKLVLTARHNLYQDECCNIRLKEFYLTKEIINGNVAVETRVSLTLVKDCSQFVDEDWADWAVLKRTDDSKFAKFVDICMEQELPSVDPRGTVGIKLFPFGLSVALATEKCTIKSSQTKVNQYEPRESQHKKARIEFVASSELKGIPEEV